MRTLPAAMHCNEHQAVRPGSESPQTTNVAPAPLTEDASSAAAGNVPSNGTEAGAHGVGVQESNIAPTETPGDGRVTTNPPVRAVASVDGVTLLRQSLRRGGLGSKALMTLTIRNRNDYPVKHLELLCSFGSPDGRYVTHRRHVIDGVVRPEQPQDVPSHDGWLRQHQRQPGEMLAALGGLGLKRE